MHQKTKTNLCLLFLIIIYSLGLFLIIGGIFSICLRERVMGALGIVVGFLIISGLFLNLKDFNIISNIPKERQKYKNYFSDRDIEMNTNTNTNMYTHSYFED